MTLAPGIWSDVPESDYHQDPTDEPSLSASVIKVLLAQSPLHAWTKHPRLNPNYRQTVSRSFDLGTTSHDLFLRGIDNVAVGPFADWRTKEAKAHREAARAPGLIPILEKDWQRTQDLVSAVRDQLAVRDDKPPLFDAGKPEQTIVWREKGVLCRARLDWLHDSLACIDDLKSTGVSGNPHDYGRRTFWSIGCDIQSRLYQRGIKAITGVEPAFRFAVVESQAPFCLSVLDLAPSAIELADHKIDAALEIWKRCLETDSWPGYPSGVASVEATWQAADFLERFWESDEQVAA